MAFFGTPDIPRETCPTIDGILSYLEDAVTDIEKVRDANAKLRAAVEYWMSQAESLQREVDKLEEKVELLEEEMQEYKNSVT